VIVNNGGDVAIRLKNGAQAIVGLRKPEDGRIFAKLKIRDTDNIGGVASSGWSGRSLSTGVADMVTAWSRTAALADAGATHIAANVRTSNLAHQNTTRASAVEHLSDLGEARVTTESPQMDPRSIREALDRGVIPADQLMSRRLISGYLMSLRDSTRVNRGARVLFYNV
jgi:hypothetical protein